MKSQNPTAGSLVGRAGQTGDTKPENMVTIEMKLPEKFECEDTEEVSSIKSFSSRTKELPIDELQRSLLQEGTVNGKRLRSQPILSETENEASLPSELLEALSQAQESYRHRPCTDRESS